MIVRGRYTLYGEYLMHDGVDGYIAPTPLSIGTPDESALPVHPTYDPAIDLVAAFLRARGVPTLSAVRGDLPLGKGFASSTALSALHLGTPDPDPTLLDEIDLQIHGFSPSGMDSRFVLEQGPGFYRAGRWRPAPPLALDSSFILFPPGPSVPIPVIYANRALLRAALGSLARTLTAGIEQGALDYYLLLEYALRLRELRVYDDRRASVVEAGTGRGIVVKGIGGLSGKALLVLWPPGCPATDRAALLHAVANAGAVLTTP